MYAGTRGVYSPAGLALALVLVLHAVLFYFLLRDQPAMENLPTVRYSRLVFISPPPPKQAVESPMQPRQSPVNTRPERRIAAGSPVPVGAPSPADATAPPVTQADPFEEPARIDIDSMVRQAGKADRETRSDKEMRGYGPAADSMEAVMTRAFTAAKLAVPLKWYEAARIELFSAPNDRKRIYQITTAFGTYCLFYRDYINEPSDPPRISSCPRRFGPGAK
ncbi:hypothetical protein GJV26_19610 [Massilia dura]|uniref:Uncharacterized protein n=1 Tax=Pseudoduganella dura TaxID=321982 RepID=A0A6I3XPU7_9BURK|nr:hypothetical protein [Pseudoduganella dura]MUI14648.1 hypothetical protein [Pseudoduganella dura]GGY04475.1 hypothetical protein GCM10007386_38980 [Pseudoduganella dura]